MRVGDGAAGDDPVVNLQHEEGAGEIEQVDEPAHEGRSDEGGTARCERRRNLGTS